MKSFIIKLLFCIGATYSSAQTTIVEPLGSGADDHPYIGRQAVRRLYVDSIDNLLYAVGNFVMMGGKLVYGVAKWDGHSWEWD